MDQPHSEPEPTVPLGQEPQSQRPPERQPDEPPPWYAQQRYDQQEYDQQGHEQPYAEQRYEQPYGQRPYERPLYPPEPYPQQQYQDRYQYVQYPPQQPHPGYGLYPVDPRQQAYQNNLYAAQKSRLAAGLLAIFLGPLGIHSFYLGRTGIGVLQLLLSVLSLGILAPLVAIWTLIEGILILTGSGSFVTDAKGIPLRD